MFLCAEKVSPSIIWKALHVSSEFLLIGSNEHSTLPLPEIPIKYCGMCDCYAEFNPRIKKSILCRCDVICVAWCQCTSICIYVIDHILAYSKEDSCHSHKGNFCIWREEIFVDSSKHFWDVPRGGQGCFQFPQGGLIRIIKPLSNPLKFSDAAKPICQPSPLLPGYISIWYHAKKLY